MSAPRMPTIRQLFQRAFFAFRDDGITSSQFMRERKIKPTDIRKGAEPYCPIWRELSDLGFDDDEWDFVRLTWVGYESVNMAVLVVQPVLTVAEMVERLTKTNVARLAGLQTYHRGWHKDSCLGVIGLPARVDLAAELGLARYWLGEAA